MVNAVTTKKTGPRAGHWIRVNRAIGGTSHIPATLLPAKWEAHAPSRAADGAPPSAQCAPSRVASGAEARPQTVDAGVNRRTRGRVRSPSIPRCN